MADEARAPAAVRNGSTTVKQAYASAQSFEELLLEQLSQSLVASSGLTGEEGEASGEEGSLEETGEAKGGMLASLLPQTLAEGVMREGGLGLAGQLLGSLDPAASTSAAPASAGAAGGVSAPPSDAPTSDAAERVAEQRGGVAA